jgi:alginate O-acetyltransferase complex protein AlgI
MLFNSYEFIILFLPITLAGFFYIGSVGHHRVAISWLVAASLFYYGWWNPAYLSLILGSIFFNYSFGVILGRQEAFSKQGFINKKNMLIIGIVINLVLLGYFKYANFFVDTINSLLYLNYNLEKIILPLAISFFTFQQIAYLVDAYRGEAREYNFLHYCLFVCFFPQLIAGPIVHHKEMLPQFAKESTYKINFENIALGFSIFIIGLFKKVVLADSLALYVEPVFGATGEYTLIQSWIGALAYTFQLYFDFSGYSDMAIGVARMFGILLPVNFNSPYKSKSIIEFWRRWHITLSTFLRDYLYIPLGGNRGGKMRKQINLMITMLLGGLWHGAGWTFVIWGGLHGLYLIINHIYRTLLNIINISLTANNNLVKSLFISLTLFCVVVGWVFFRALDFNHALHILASMMGLNKIGKINLSSDMPAILLLLVSFLIVWVLPNAQQYMYRYNFSKQEKYEEIDNKFKDRLFNFGFNKISSAIISIMILLIIMMMQSVRKSEFLYYDF